MKTNETIERSYIISNKDLKKLCGFKGDITTIELHEGRSPDEETAGVSSDVELWEIKTKEIVK